MKSNVTNEQQLKRAIQEQLDLILKIQEDRKLLKKENKSLNQKYNKLSETLKKYSNITRADKGIQTQPQKPTVIQKIEEVVVQKHTRGCQVDLIIQQQNQSILTNQSKLHEAMQFLKAVDSTTCQPYVQQYTNNSSLLQNMSLRRHQQQSQRQAKQKDKQKKNDVTQQIIKMSKQISCLKRQLKQSQNVHKQRQKQLKQVKRCLQTKGQALQKCRKQFNQLSQLLNTDKYKSIRNLQAETQKYRVKAEKIDQQNKVIHNLKDMLQNLASQYQQYRQEKERKIISLTNDLRTKNQEIQQLQIVVGQCKNQLKLMHLS